MLEPGRPLTSPIFGRSVNPIETREGRLSPSKLLLTPPNFFHLPASTTYILRMSKCKVINKIYIFGNVYYLHFSMDKNLIQIRILQWKSSRILENFSILFWCTFEIFLEIFIHGTCSQIHHYWLQQNFRKRIKH